jgi:16S rRNA (guanine527-N7)-methyltransferase
MSLFYDPFSAVPGFELEARIRSRASECGIDLTDAALNALAHHARAVLRENEQLHLTSITEPVEFVERHLGEAFEGAAMLPPDIEGQVLDVGSGNGYPGFVLGAARPGLSPVLADASVRKAAFLRAVIRDAGFPSATVLEAQIQRATDLDGEGPFRLIMTRALGGWPKILPRLRTCLAEGGDILIWTGDEMEKIARREVWMKLRLEEKRPLPTRDQSWIWRFRVA